MSTEPAIKASLVWALTQRVAQLDREMNVAVKVLEMRVDALEHTLIDVQDVYVRALNLLKEAGRQ
jgi:3-dehydroquinate dehydratase